MEDFIINQQKVSIANRKFLDLCRSNQDDWVTCDQAEGILNHIGFKSSARMDDLISEADCDGLNQIIWENLLGIINYLTTNDNAGTDTNGLDHSDEGAMTNENDQLANLPDDVEVKHNLIDFAQTVLQLAAENGAVSKEQVFELAKEFHIKKKE